jgi:hypothetical protein
MKQRPKKKKKKKNIQRTNKTKRWFFEKINKMDKPLANVTKMRMEKTQIRKMRTEKGEIKTSIREIQGNHQRLL